MDVVKTNVERIAGTIEIHSDLGVGTTIRMKIPLTLAIIPALIVDSRSECYAIPQVSVRELVLLDGENLKRVKSVNGTPVYRLRGRLLPLIFLAQELDLGGTRDLEHLFVVVLTVDGADFGLVVDGVRDTEEIVVKPLGYELGRLALYAGATIRGDGSVALILDVAGLAHHAGVLSKMGGTMLADESSKPVPSVIPVGRETFLLFEGLRGTPVAVPLARIERLEEFDGRSFELVSGQDVVQYRSEVMPVVHLSHFVGGASLEECRHRYVEEPLQTVVFRRGQHSLGLVVSQLVDIVEAHVEFRDVGRRRGILGTAVMQSKVVELLDIDALLDTALPRSTGTAVGGS